MELEGHHSNVIVFITGQEKSQMNGNCPGFIRVDRPQLFSGVGEDMKFQVLTCGAQDIYLLDDNTAPLLLGIVN